MRDMALPILAERLVDVVEHGPNVRAGGQRLTEPDEERSRIRLFVDGAVPVDEALHDRRLAPRLAVHQALPLLDHALARWALEPGRLGLLERLLHLEHLLEQI